MSSRPPAPDAETTLALAHAMRTPLTSLALGLGLLDEGALGPLNEAQREVVSALVADVARLSILVGRDLDTAHLGAYAGPIDLVPTDLDALVAHAITPLLPQARERAVELTCATTPGITAVVDPVKMGWVIASVIGNALRYSPRGGAVTVRLACTAEQAELAIGDQGPGMMPEVKGRLFDRGGGLGLYLAREIIEAHGGTITVDSAPGLGSTFTIKLPIGE